MLVRRLMLTTSLALTLLYLGCSSGDTPLAEESRLLLYNSSQELLAGDLWDVTTAQRIAADLRALPSGWPVVGLATTDRVGANGEVLVRGTSAAPEFRYADPSRQGTLSELGPADLPFAAVAACDPAHAVTSQPAAGTDLLAAVADLAGRAGFELAAVSFGGELSDVTYSVAYNLPKTGTPLGADDTLQTAYLRFFDSAEPLAWTADGFFAVRAADRALLSRPGQNAALVGARTADSLGGRLVKAKVVSGQLTLWPLRQRVTRQADLAVPRVEIWGDIITYHIANLGTNPVTHSPVTIEGGGRLLWSGDLGPIAAGTERVRQLIAPEVFATSGLRVTVDPAQQITESDETNNRWPPS